MPTNKINYNFYLGLITASTIIFGYWLVIIPQLKEAQEASRQLTDVSSQYQTASQRLETIKQFDMAIKSRKADYDLLTSALPTDQDVGGVLVTLEAIAAKTGVGVVSLEPGKGEDSTGLQPVTMHVQAGYTNLINLMNALQKNLRPISLTSATITKPVDSDALDASLALQFLYSAKPATSQNQATQPAAQAQ